jgi:hypothetical protein
MDVTLCGIGTKDYERTLSVHVALGDPTTSEDLAPGIRIHFALDAVISRYLTYQECKPGLPPHRLYPDQYWYDRQKVGVTGAG